MGGQRRAHGVETLVTGRPAGRYAHDGRVGWHVPRRGAFLVPPWRGVTALAALLAAGLVAAGLLQKRYCFEHGWGGSDVFWHACFSDLPRLWAGTPLASHALPYAAGGGGIDQPVGTGLMLWVLAWFVPRTPTSQQAFTAAWAVAAAACAIGIVVCTATTTRRHPQRALYVGACPLLVTVALVSPELFAVLLVSAGLWAWSAERPGLAGVLLGLAAVSRGYAVLVLLAVGLVALRAGVLRAWSRTAGAALVVAAGLLLSVQLTAGGAVAPYLAWLGRGIDYGSIWYLATLAGRPVPPATATVLAVAGWVLALAAGTMFTLLPRRRPAIAEVAVVVLAVLFLTAKSVPVQASMWLVPLVALAGVRLRPYLIWVSAEVAYFVAVWLYIAGGSEPNRALPAAWYAAFLLIRLAAIAWVALDVVGRARRRPAPTVTADPADPAPQQSVAIAEDPDDGAGVAGGRRDDLVLVAGR